MTIDQDRCRSATHSLQQSHVDNIPSPFPPRQTPVAARYGLFHALPWRPSLTAALGLSGGLLALLLRRPLVGRGAGPRAGLVRLALAGEVQGGRLHVLPCADEIDLAWTQGSREWLALETFIDT